MVESCSELPSVFIVEHSNLTKTSCAIFSFLAGSPRFLSSSHF